MSKRSYPKSWGKWFEKYCDMYLPERKEEICEKADHNYTELLKQMPEDTGGKANGMNKNFDTWFTIVAFYEASDHVIDGEAFQIIYNWSIDGIRFLGKLIDGNKSKLIYKLFADYYKNYEKKVREHRAKGEWKNTWDVAINPEHRTEGCSFHLIGCPIAKHAKEHGYEKLLPYLCKTDHILTEVLHARLIRTQTEIMGGTCCDYWYIGDRNPALEQYKDLERI